MNTVWGFFKKACAAFPRSGCAARLTSAWRPMRLLKILPWATRCLRSLFAEFKKSIKKQDASGRICGSTVLLFCLFILYVRIVVFLLKTDRVVHLLRRVALPLGRGDQLVLNVIAAVNDADGEVYVAKFEEIVGYEVVERHVGNVCKELGLLIKFSSLDKPFVKYDLYFKETIGMRSDSAMFRTCKESLMQTTAVLDYIKTINNTSK